MENTDHIVNILNKFQLHSFGRGLCFIKFKDVFKFLTKAEQEALMQVCDLNIESIEKLDRDIASKELLINPYKFSLYGHRFVRVTPELWRSFEQMSDKLNAETKLRLKIKSGYRSPAYQSLLFLKEYYLHDFDESKTKTLILSAGKSEHQDLKQLAIDIAVNGDKTINDNVYNWLDANAETYGFINSYPKRSNVNSIQFEPWHWRFQLK